MASDFSVPDWLVDRADADASADPDPVAAEREAVRRYGRILSASSAASRALTEIDGGFAADTDFATAPARYRAALDAVGREHEGTFDRDEVGRGIFRRDFGTLAEHAIQRFQFANAGREAAHLARTLEDRWDSLAGLARDTDEAGRAAILRQAALEAHRAKGFGLVLDADVAFRGFLDRLGSEDAPHSFIRTSATLPNRPESGIAPTSLPAETRQIVAEAVPPAVPRKKPAPSPAESPLGNAERGRMLDALAPHEGAISDDPEDTLTHYGVTIEGLNDYKSRATPDDPIMKKQVKDLTRADTRVILDEIMRQYRADRIEDRHLRQHIFDTIVNHPPKLAITMWQRAPNEGGFSPKGVALEEDGTLGPATRAAVNGLTAEQRRALNEAVVGKRIELYREIVQKHSEKKKYETGWLKRANSFRLP
ncbi:MAG: hypothetical protein NTY59_08055 [Alphaproteobacteria bacterium]|nr:hypothetical protein [Alphaproteobacteria bacterium]